MSNKHTPGSWRYLPNLRFTQEQAHDGYAYPYLIYAGAEFVAQIATDQMCEFSKDEDNARLIAAAPDLLAALQIAEGIIHNAIDNGVPVRAHLAYIRAAIAKARP